MRRPFLAGFLLAAATPLHAQVAVELRGGGAIGNHTPAAGGLETIPGPSFAGALFLVPRRWIGIYATYARSAFGCEEGFCTDREVLVTTAAVGGGARLYPLRWLWLQGGVVNLTTTVDANGVAEPESAALGYETGVGFRIPIAGRVSLVPAFTYRSGVEEVGRTAILAGELGVQLRLR